MVAAGRLRHRVVIQYPFEVQDSNNGAMGIDWRTLATVWAAIEPISAKEFVAAQADQTNVTTRIMIRKRTDVNFTHRIFHPSSGDYFDIRGVIPDKDTGKEYLTLACAEGVRYV
jgi:SPP1 family predicted phage head-tail adaptor